ncbi:MAG: hypothetical protein Q7T82_18700 [Armatimonadota bacterium]|nr:hypothetical protein [Armatimonadota bacterium]
MVLVVLGATIILCVWGGSTPGETRASVIAGVVLCAAGIAIGTGVFCVARSVIQSWAGRLVAPMLAGPLSCIAGAMIGLSVVSPLWDELVFKPHPEEYTGDLVYQGLMVYSGLFAGLIGTIFGAGLGQPLKRRQQASLGDQTEV